MYELMAVGPGVCRRGAEYGGVRLVILYFPIVTVPYAATLLLVSLGQPRALSQHSSHSVIWPSSETWGPRLFAK